MRLHSCRWAFGTGKSVVMVKRMEEGKKEKGFRSDRSDAQRVGMLPI